MKKKTKTESAPAPQPDVQSQWLAINPLVTCYVMFGADFANFGYLIPGL